MSLKSANDIFASVTQILNLDGQEIVPLFDRVVIEDHTLDVEKEGSIFIPEVARDKPLIRTGRVVAVGPGDNFVERGLNRFGVVKRKWLDHRLPMQVKVGDLVLYDRRREAEFEVGGRRLSLVNEQQSVLAVLE